MATELVNREQQARNTRPVTPLSTDGQPSRHVVFDTEAQLHRHGTTITQTWAVAASAVAHLDRAGEWQVSEPVVHASPDGLWDAVIAEHRSGSRLIVWAHGLAYDLRISRALELLPRKGYALTGIVLADHGGWAAFKGDRGTLLCCDLSAWVNVPLAQIASDLGLSQAPVDFAGATVDELAARCRGDVAITAAAVTTLMRFVRDERLGPFRPTGAGQSYAAWRRRFLTETVIVHDDTAVLEVERRAMWTGRCEAWRWGTVDRGDLTELDLNLAYCRLAARESVPVELLREVAAPSHGDYLRWRKLGAVMAEVDVSTSLPLVPCELGDRIAWPVGRFSTVLWAPEVDLLLSRGATVRFRRLWLYRTRPALRAFAEWLIGRLEGSDAADGLLQRRLLKHWSRTAVGRMALRYRAWSWAGRHPDFDLGLMLMVDADTGERGEQLQVGHDLFELSELAEAEASTPCIVGWVMSACRVDLWQLMEAAGLDHVLYVDTDSLLVDATGARQLQAPARWPQAADLRLKGTYRRVTIIGPRQLDLDADARFAGVSKRSTRRGPLEFDSERWSSIHTSLASPAPDSVVVERVPVRLAGKDPRRLHLPGGGTAPITIGR